MQVASTVICRLVCEANVTGDWKGRGTLGFDPDACGIGEEPHDKQDALFVQLDAQGGSNFTSCTPVYPIWEEGEVICQPSTSGCAVLQKVASVAACRLDGTGPWVWVITTEAL